MLICPNCGSKKIVKNGRIHKCPKGLALKNTSSHISFRASLQVTPDHPMMMQRPNI